MACLAEFLVERFFKENEIFNQTPVSLAFNGLVIEYVRKLADETPMDVIIQLAYTEFLSVINSTDIANLYYPDRYAVVSLLHTFGILVNMDTILHSPLSHLRIFILYIELILKLYSNYDFSESIDDLGAVYTNGVFTTMTKELEKAEYPFNMKEVFNSIKWLLKIVNIPIFLFDHTSVKFHEKAGQLNISLLFRRDIDLHGLSLHPGLFLTSYKRYTRHALPTIADLVGKQCYTLNSSKLTRVLIKYLSFNFDYHVLTQLKKEGVNIQALPIGITFFNLIQLSCFSSMLDLIYRVNSLRELAICFIEKKWTKKALRDTIDAINLTIYVYSNEELEVFHTSFSYQCILFRSTMLVTLQNYHEYEKSHNCVNSSSKRFKQILNKISLLLKKVYTQQSLRTLAYHLKMLI